MSFMDLKKAYDKGALWKVLKLYGEEFLSRERAKSASKREMCRSRHRWICDKGVCFTMAILFMDG